MHKPSENGCLGRKSRFVTTTTPNVIAEWDVYGYMDSEMMSCGMELISCHEANTSKMHTP